MRLPYALLATATAAWSPLRLERDYLACASRKLPKFEVFTSFRSVSNGDGDHSLFARDFYNAFLAFWPPEHHLIILHEADGRTARPVQRLVQCLQRATCLSKPVARPFDLSALIAEHKVADTSQQVNANFTSIDDVQMQAWKYVLDLHSEAELLGVLDDDACLLDHVLRGDLMSCSDKIIVRGVRFEKRPIKTKHEVSNGFLGIASDVNFMVDFPVKKTSNALQPGVSRGLREVFLSILGRVDLSEIVSKFEPHRSTFPSSSGGATSRPLGGTSCATYYGRTTPWRTGGAPSPNY